jgi:hypothetical protein
MRQLYAAAVELRAPDGTMHPQMRYMHAKEDGHQDERRYVELCFLHQHSREIVSGQMRVIGIAPAIGFHVHDDHGEVLSA